MSLNGSVTRRLELCTIEWERHLLEEEVELSRGWNVTITLPFVSVTFREYGWGPWRETWRNRLTRRPARWGGCVSALGMAVEASRENLNDFALTKHGDAEMLLSREEKEWHSRHVIDQIGFAEYDLDKDMVEDLPDDTLIYIACRCGICVSGARVIETPVGPVDGIMLLEGAMTELHEDVA